MFPLWIFMTLFIPETGAYSCACATGSVHVRSGAGTSNSILGVLTPSECATSKNQSRHVGGLDWDNIDYNGQDAWVASNWLSVSSNGCACATGNVNARSGAGTSHSIMGTLTSNQCVKFKCEKTTVGGLVWANVEYENNDAWVAINWLTFKECPVSGSTSVPSVTTSAPTVPGCPRIISRSEWKASPPARQFGHFTHIPNHVYVHHGASSPCFSESACAAEVRAYQNYHINGHGWPDIGYSFVIGEDGNVYEANGWDIVGAHTYGHNSDGIGICIIGDFQERAPNAAALTALQDLIQCGIKLHKLPSDYVMEGHCDVRQTSCPGRKLLDVISGWSHYHRPATSHCPN